MPRPYLAIARALATTRVRASSAPALLALLVAGGFVLAMLFATDGHFVPQVPDLYMVCQYAKAMAEGHAFQYNAGDPPSTGATSLLHTALLAAAHAAGLRGELLVAFAVACGAAFYVASVATASRLARRLAGDREGLLAGLLVALGGPVVWGFLSGGDVGLFMYLALGLFEGWLALWEQGRPARFAVFGALLALARPEGSCIGLGLAAFWSRFRGTPPSRAVAGLTWLPALVGAGVLGLQRAVTGQWVNTSMAGKSLLENYPPWEALGLAAEYGVDVIRGLLLGFYPSQAPLGLARGWASLCFPPLGLLFVGAALARAPEALKAPLKAWALIVALAFALVSSSIYVGVHYNRHLLWAFPGLLALVAAGVGAAARLAGRADATLDRAVFRTTAATLILLASLSTLRFATLYGQAAGDIYLREVQTARWIERSLPPGARILDVATSVEYLTGHRNVNVSGVMSPAFQGGRSAEREAVSFELWGDLPAPERPEFLLTSESAQASSGYMGELVNALPLFRSASFGDELLVYRLRSDALDRNRRMRSPAMLQAVARLAEVDRLNVCDPRDEQRHGYRWASRAGPHELNGSVRVDAYAATPQEKVIDAGRVIFGSEAFDVRTRAGRDLTMVMRAAPEADALLLEGALRGRHRIELREALVLVKANGRDAAQALLRPSQGWNEWSVVIPAGLVGDGLTRVELAGRYTSFFYWFFQ